MKEINISSRMQQIAISISACILVSVIWPLLSHPIIAIAAGILPIAIIVILWKPFLMVLLFVAFSFFRIHEVFPLIYDFKIPLLLSLASLSALFWHIAVTRKITVYWCKELTALSIFFGLVLIGVFMASNRPVAIEYFKNIYFKIILMTYAIAFLTRTTKDFSLAGIIITLSGCLVGIVALFNKANSIGIIEGTRVTIGRDIGSILGDPNDLALVLMFPASFAVSLTLTKGLSKFNRLFGLTSVSILFFAIVATQSRGGLLGILAVFGIYGYRRIKSKALFISISIVCCLVLYLAAGISGRSSGGAIEEGIDASSMGRLFAWEAAFGMAVHNPLTGVGIDNFYSNYYYYSSHWDGLNHAVHSTWFGVLAETGFLGLLVFIIIVTLLLKSAYRSLFLIELNQDSVNPVIHSTSQAVFAGLIGTVVSGTFLTQGFTWPIYILSALVVAISRWTNANLHVDLTPKKKSILQS
ncbi:MAG: oligosaccharide repeat unit polymerase [Moraxellaceae bacterium]|nr:MAG: oligosaccharide repeat unit polymerase [Moraxellaceae bacterium]